MRDRPPPSSRTRRRAAAAGLLLLGLGAATGLLAEESSAAPAAPRTDYRIPREVEGTRIDGVLDEAQWERALTFELPYETRPGENIAPPVRTECRMFYTERHLYYGCHAYDEPREIRARLRDRDTASFSDDVVGLSVDPFNNAQASLVFDVNPLGVQNDRRYTEQQGRSDRTWDATWRSAGRIVDDGYVVEVEIPFTEIRLPRSVGEQVWGFNFRRYRPHDVSRRFSIVPNDRNNPCRLCQNAELRGLAGIDPGRSLEVTPTVTALRTAERTNFPGGEIEAEDPDVEGGVTARWGLTSNLTLSGTVNPDFSQVEADAAQLDINNQFALFFQERRPFFLEGADTFLTHQRAVHTRAIANPRWGLKLTGREGPNTIGAFVAEDETTTLLFPGSRSSSLGRVERSNTSAVLRYRRDLGNASNVGVLYTDRTGGDYENRVAGLDARYRLTDSDLFEVQLLGSRTLYPEEIRSAHGQPEGTLEDWMGYLAYTHEERNWELGASVEQVGGEFRADLGFIPQVDVRRLAGELEYQWYGSADNWFTNIEVGTEAVHIETIDGEELGEEGGLNASYSGPLQTNVSLGFQHFTRVLEGRDLDNSVYWMEGGFQPTASVGFGYGLEIGRGIDFREARQGQELTHGPFLQLELGRHLQATLSGTRSELSLSGQPLFVARQTELRLVYQFDVRAFLRAILQYTDVDRNPELYSDPVDRSEQDLFGQLLFSYKVTPLTALYLGYTGAYLEIERSGLLETGNTLFFKVGYAWRP